MRNLYEALVSRDMPIQVLGYGDGPMPPSVTHIRFDSRMRFVTRFLASIPGSSLIHGHSWLTSHPDLAALHGYAWLIRAKRLRWVESLHSGSLPERYATWSRPDRGLYVRLVRRAERLIVVSHTLREFLVDIGVRADKIAVIGPLLPPGLALQPREPGGAISRFVAAHDPVVLAVGAMLPTYDYDALAEAFSGLRRTHSKAGLLLVSTGSAVDEGYRARILAQLEDHTQHVLELLDVPHDELLGIMGRAAVVVRAFPLESYGLSRVEALLMGIPVVATAVGEQHGVIGYVDGDAVSLETALRRALASPAPDPVSMREHFARLARANLDSILEVYASCG